MAMPNPYVHGSSGVPSLFQLNTRLVSITKSSKSSTAPIGIKSRLLNVVHRFDANTAGGSNIVSIAKYTYAGVRSSLSQFTVSITNSNVKTKSSNCLGYGDATYNFEPGDCVIVSSNGGGTGNVNYDAALVFQPVLE